MVGSPLPHPPRVVPPTRLPLPPTKASRTIRRRQKVLAALARITDQIRGT